MGPWFHQTSVLFFLKKNIYVCIHERHTERGRDTGRGRSRLLVGSTTWDSIPGPWDHDLSRRQTLNHWATQVPLSLVVMDSWVISSSWQGSHTPVDLESLYCLLFVCVWWHYSTLEVWWLVWITAVKWKCFASQSHSFIFGGNWGKKSLILNKILYS